MFYIFSFRRLVLVPGVFSSVFLILKPVVVHLAAGAPV